MLFKQYQPSLQYFFSNSENKIDEICSMIQIESLVQKENKIELFHVEIGEILNGKAGTELEFPTNRMNINKIIKR